MITRDEINNVVNARKDEAINYLMKALTIPSPTGHEKEMGDQMTEWIKEMGLKPEVLEYAKGRPNVIAEWEGNKGGKRFLLNGHLDVFPPTLTSDGKTNAWDAKIEDGYIFGRGAVDMKGGNIAGLMAVKWLKEMGFVPNGTIILSYVSDEEAGGAFGTLQLLQTLGFHLPDHSGHRCSVLCAVCDEGVFEEYLFLPANPNLALMDTDVIAASPVRITMSGIGDALATYYEARACKQGGAPSFVGADATEVAFTIAKLCRDTLLAEGVKAKVALEKKACTPAVEKIIEANTLMSGIGFESVGVAGAHAVHNGLTALEECHKMYHGEKVAFGTITQLILEDVPADELEQIVTFCIQVGLPVTMEQLGVKELTDEKVMTVAKLACAEGDTMGNMPFNVTPEMVAEAIKGADAIGHYYMGR